MSKPKAFIFDFWGVIFRDGAVDTSLLATIATLKQQHVTAILSNMGRYSFDEYMNAADQAAFTDIFLSGETGLHKPRPEAFAHIVEQLDVAASECFFVDDVADNVQAAEALGMQAMLFTDAPALIEKLQELQ